MLLCVKAQLTNWGQLPEPASWGSWVTQTSVSSAPCAGIHPLVTFTHSPGWCRQISTRLIFIAWGVKRFWPLSRSKFGKLRRRRSQDFSTLSGSVPSVDPSVFLQVQLHYFNCRRERGCVKEREREGGKKTTTNHFCQGPGSVGSVKTDGSRLFMIGVGSFVQIIQLYENFQLQLPPVSAAARVGRSREWKTKWSELPDVP